MNLVKCQKCGTTVLTTGTLEERLTAEKEELEADIEKFGKSKKLKAEKHQKYQRVCEINRLLKQLRHQVRAENSVIHEYFAKYLIQELATKFGYTDEQFHKWHDMAEQDLENRRQGAKREIRRIYGEADRMLSNNEWRNAEGYNDPTAKKAIEGVRYK